MLWPEPTSKGSVPDPEPVSGVQLIVPRPVFADLYRAHFAYVWKSARRLGVAPSDVDDVVQETFLTVHRLLDSYVAQGTERGWLFSVLFRIVQRHRRTHARRDARNVDDAIVESMPASASAAPDRTLEANEEVRMLEEILDTFEPEQRAILVLCDVEEQPVAEAARILDINPNTAASRLRTARERLETSVARYRARETSVRRTK